MKVRKQISIDEKVLEKGLIRAEELFAGNFSIYLSYLINQDAGDIKIDRVEKETKNNGSEFDEETKSEIDNILGL
ncbi:hypothetical protein [Clostridium sardiniense]|uniref:hypothetical protein n=1 Tax=Clostridium sardiniense TaxID=29369 RepID=UPI00195D2CC6|nr:hypothetical protein [Clostridium sardiniense]MBM7836453.1 hypothetical protein [Clostridium sardiniense]